MIITARKIISEPKTIFGIKANYIVWYFDTSRQNKLKKTRKKRQKINKIKKFNPTVKMAFSFNICTQFTLPEFPRSKAKRHFQTGDWNTVRSIRGISERKKRGKIIIRRTTN